MQNNQKDRGMKKWRPFASLPEHMEYIDKCNRDKKKTKKNKKSNDLLDEINEKVEKSLIYSTNLVLILNKKGEIIKKACFPQSFDFENRILIVKNENNKKERIPIIEIIDVIEN